MQHDAPARLYHILEAGDAIRIIGFRNILVHGYADIFDEMVWQRIEDDLPILLREVRALLAESDPPPGSGGLPA